MKAVEITSGSLSVRITERSCPIPGRGEVLIAVRAAGVIPTELQWYPSTHTKEGTPRERATPGHEFAGTIAALGEEVNDYRVGDRVFGMNDWFAEGATAEFCVTTPAQIAPLPIGMSDETAATVPISALTAWQGLIERGHLKRGERVLTHGAAGAVGLYAVQLARMQEASVLATASSNDIEFLKGLGADEVIDYKTQRFEDAGPFDLIFDTVGGEVLERSFHALAPGGRVVTIAANAEGISAEHIKASFFIVEPSHEQLVTIAALLEQKKLIPFVKASAPFSEAGAAYANALPGTMSRGKIVIVL
jgi:NADPH:quinone reductase-like Zn-dependent oxidoreductase